MHIASTCIGHTIACDHSHDILSSLHILLISLYTNHFVSSILRYLCSESTSEHLLFFNSFITSLICYGVGGPSSSSSSSWLPASSFSLYSPLLPLLHLEFCQNILPIYSLPLIVLKVLLFGFYKPGVAVFRFFSLFCLLIKISQLLISEFPS